MLCLYIKTKEVLRMKSYKRFLLAFCVVVPLLSVPVQAAATPCNSSCNIEEIAMSDSMVIESEDDAEELVVFYRTLTNGIKQYRIWSATYAVWRTEWTDLPGQGE